LLASRWDSSKQPPNNRLQPSAAQRDHADKAVGLRLGIGSRSLLVVGMFSMLLSLACENVTLASGSYRGILLLAVGAMVLADTCLSVVFVRGGRLRWVALLMAAPSAFIVWDFIRRAPYVF
jgi:hypothetical protein